MLYGRDHSFSTYSEFSGELTFFPLISTRTCAYQGVRNVSFSENFAYVLNEWSLTDFVIQALPWVIAICDLWEISYTRLSKFQTLLELEVSFECNKSAFISYWLVKKCVNFLLVDQIRYVKHHRLSLLENEHSPNYIVKSTRYLDFHVQDKISMKTSNLTVYIPCLVEAWAI